MELNISMGENAKLKGTVSGVKGERLLTPHNCNLSEINPGDWIIVNGKNYQISSIRDSIFISEELENDIINSEFYLLETMDLGTVEADSLDDYLNTVNDNYSNLQSELSN